MLTETPPSSAFAPTTPQRPTTWQEHFFAFVAEKHPLLVPAVSAYIEAHRDELAALDTATTTPEKWRQQGEDAAAFLQAHILQTLSHDAVAAPAWQNTEVTPFINAQNRLHILAKQVYDDICGFFIRLSYQAKITDADRLWMLRGIILTRAVDNRMKQMFLSSELTYNGVGFQGKGFRSLGQEAIYASALFLRRGLPAGQNDAVAPLIRDLGVALAFTDDPLSALNAQAGKQGPPVDGRDLHAIDLERGVVGAAAPLTIATHAALGLALSFQRKQEDRVAVSFIGEGGSSLGEWHEAINFAAVQKLPMIFCVQNNQTALSTPVEQQSKVRLFADKAAGYGIPSITIDGTDPEAIATTFAWAAERARAQQGPTLVEIVAMRLSGHAHHDDMLYLGYDPPLSFQIPPLKERGYADAARYRAWAARDPLVTYTSYLRQKNLIDDTWLPTEQQKAVDRCNQAMDELRQRPWPDAAKVGTGVFAEKTGTAIPDAATAIAAWPSSIEIPNHPKATTTHDFTVVEDAPAYTPKGKTYLDAIAEGLQVVFDQTPEALLLGEDVGAPYGNAFLLLKPILDKHHNRIINTPIAEGAILGACVGAALGGMRPVGEMQFNDFVASGFNQLVNHAAMLHYRTGKAVPMTLRMPWGGLRRAGPYHSQDTAPWFYRTPGLKIVAPSTPQDAYELIMSAVLDDNPVLFYEHIGLYRDPSIKQELRPIRHMRDALPLGRAALRRSGGPQGADLSVIAYGAYVHRACAAADLLAKEEITCDVLDLRSLNPLDWDAIAATVKRSGKVLLVGEDHKTGSILESIASRIQEALFADLDAPVRVLGALDTPVPYAPSLEDAYLLSPSRLLETARALAVW